MYEKKGKPTRKAKDFLNYLQTNLLKNIGLQAILLSLGLMHNSSACVCVCAGRKVKLWFAKAFLHDLGFRCQRHSKKHCITMGTNVLMCEKDERNFLPRCQCTRH